MVAVHFRENGTNRRSYEEMEKLAQLSKTMGQYPILLGADKKLESLEAYEYSEGAQFLAAEALKEDVRPLYVLCTGALTDMAAAILKHPEIQDRLTVVWVGGGRYLSAGADCFPFPGKVLQVRDQQVHKPSHGNGIPYHGNSKAWCHSQGKDDSQ